MESLAEISDKLLHQSRQRPALIVVPVVVLILLWLLITTLLEAWSSYRYTPVPEPSASQTAATATLNVAYSVPAITGANLFGQYQAGDRMASSGALPETQLNLELKAVFSSEDPKLGTAVIFLGGDRPQSFRAGNEVSPGIILDEVYPDRVILSQMGRRETLFFPAVSNPSNRLADYAAVDTSSASPVSSDVVSDTEKQALILKRLRELRNR